MDINVTMFKDDSKRLLGFDCTTGSPITNGATPASQSFSPSITHEVDQSQIEQTLMLVFGKRNDRDFFDNSKK